MPIKLRIDEQLESLERRAPFPNKSRYWLAKELRMSQATIWKYAGGRTKGITWDTLERFCYALECSPADLIEQV